jgi:hypothetical protein
MLNIGRRIARHREHRGLGGAYRGQDCEHAPKVDPANVRPIRRLRRRSAFGPGAH